MNLAAVILAGGGSTRMGRDKAGLRLGGRTLLAQTIAVVQEAALAVQVIGRGAPVDAADQVDGFAADAYMADHEPGLGPLRAIIQALQLRHGCDLLVLSCDYPLLTVASVRFLIAAWAARTDGALGLVPTCAGEPQPLAAIYAAGAAEALQTAWSGGERSVRRVVTSNPGFSALALPPEIAVAFEDCDTPEDWARLTRS